jgi:alpha-glucosidase
VRTVSERDGLRGQGMSACPLLDPHHDGSPLYVDNQRPALGSTVRVRVRVPHDADGSPGARTVVLRSVKDGEPALVIATETGTDEYGSWWSAALRVHNPLMSYRFVVSRDASDYRWLNAAGVHRHDVTDASDFKISTEHDAPDWVADQVGYQVFPHRFAKTDAGAEPPPWAKPADWDDPVVHEGPTAPFQWYGGTLDGVTARLEHLVLLGATMLYLTPVFEAWSSHRYDASSFDRVDPVLGGDDALDRLIRASHDLGIRVMGDLTTNHTGAHHDWFLKARADPDSVERGFFRFDGNGYAAWLGIPSLPKLDHGSAELRRRLYDGQGSVVARWLRQGPDGWRIDVANMTGRLGEDDYAHEVARVLRRTMRATSADSWLLAEHGHDASLDLQGDGWHGTMDYAGFTRPVWCWLNGGQPGGPGVEHGLSYLGIPVNLPVLPATAAVRTMRDVHAAMPWAALTAWTLHLDSHDTPRFRTVTGGGVDGWIDSSGRGRARHLTGLALQMTMPGVPVVFMGDELGLTGVDGEHARTPYPWGRSDEWDQATLEAYHRWVALRKAHIALRRGGLRWVAVGHDSMTYLREHPDQTVLVHVNRTDCAPVELPLAPLGLDSARQLHSLVGEPAVGSRPGVARLPGDGPGAHLMVLDPRAG